MYTIIIISSSQQLLLIFEAQIVILGATTVAIPISWKSAGTENVSYEVMWETDDIGGCSGGSDMNSTTVTDGYDIMGLEENTTYTITVTAFNSVGSSAVSNPVTAITRKAGENYVVIMISYCDSSSTHSSIWSSHFCGCL